VFETELFTEKRKSLRADPFLSLFNHYFHRQRKSFLQDENGENGKYCASYYLFTYLHFFFFLPSRVKEMREEKGNGKSIFS
jgi:hypothetical protein